MKIGDIVDKIPAECPQCGERSGGIDYDWLGLPCQFTFDCEFSIDLGLDKIVGSMCKNGSPLSEKNNCTCDIRDLMIRGCICGQIDREKNL